MTLLKLVTKAQHKRRGKKRETQYEFVFHIRLRHPEKKNNVSVNSVSQIRQTGDQPVLHLEVSCFRIAHTVNKTSSKQKSGTPFFDKEKQRHWSLFRACSNEKTFLKSNTLNIETTFRKRRR